MQIQQANYYKIIGRDTNSLQANTRRAPHDLIMLVIIDPRGRRGRGGEGKEKRRTAPPPPPPPTTPFLFFSLLKVNFPLRLPPFAVQILPLPSTNDTIVEDRNEHRLRQSETSFVV